MLKLKNPDDGIDLRSGRIEYDLELEFLDFGTQRSGPAAEPAGTRTGTWFLGTWVSIVVYLELYTYCAYCAVYDTKYLSVGIVRLSGNKRFPSRIFLLRHIVGAILTIFL